MMNGMFVDVQSWTHWQEGVQNCWFYQSNRSFDQSKLIVKWYFSGFEDGKGASKASGVERDPEIIQNKLYSLLKGTSEFGSFFRSAYTSFWMFFLLQMWIC